jgi:glycosyltransferase involved in cell wall biosynthesis
MKVEKVISIVIPAYNEEKTLSTILQKVLDVKLVKGFEKEIIIVNDCSTDHTLAIAESFANRDSRIKVLSNPQNLGKSRSVRAGILVSTGDYVVIQDADLEYEPQDFADMLAYAEQNGLDVVYGNRFGKQNKVIYWQNYYGNKLLSLVSNLFTYGRIRVYIPDMETCYKLVRGDVMRELAKKLQSTSNFGFEPEITARLSKYNLGGRKLKFGVYPISYYPRTVEEGKKMKAFRDGFKALLEIIYYNMIG